MRQNTRMSNTPPVSYNTAAAGWRRKIEALGYPKAYRALLDRHAPAPIHRMSVLDAGCGTGDFAAALVATRGTPHHLTLLDPAPEMLAIAQHHVAGAEPRQGVIEDLARGAQFDLILSAHALEHCPDLAQSLVCLAGVLRDGGTMILVLSKPHWCNLLIWLSWRHRILPPTRVREAAHLAGLLIDVECALTEGPPSRTSRAYILSLSPSEALC